MHRVKQWAHSSAHESRFNPWSQSSDIAVLTGAPGPARTPTGGEPEKDKPKEPLLRRFLKTQKTIWLHSWINVLLIFVPVGFAVHFAGVNQNVVFALNAIAIIPLAGLLTFATECVAHRLGPTLGALMNVSFGNAVELIIFIIALVKNEIRIVQASLIGSILANLLLILGMAFFIGGLEYQEQIYDSTITQMSACLLALSVLSLLIPTAFHASFNDTTLANAAVLKVSRGTSVILLVIYVLYLLFQLKSHSYLYQGTPQKIIDEQTQPGVLARFDSTSSTSSSSTRSSTTGSISGRRRVSKKIKAKLGRRRRTEVEIVEENGTLTEHPAEDDGNATNSKEPTNEKTFVDQSLPPTVGEGPGTTTALPSAPSAKAKRPMASKGLSFRPPPVFRNPSGFNPSQPAAQHPNLRRLRSAPNTNQPHQRVWTDPENSTATNSHPRHASNAVSPQPERQGSTAAASTTEESDDPPISQTAAIILLLVSTALVALCAEFLVDSINSLVKTSPLSEAFIGLILLPIVGNAAEHVTAVTVAAKNKLDLALGVSLGSSIQIALFVTPIVVLLGWILDKPMSLYFTLFETASLFVSTFIVNFLVLDGRSNYLEGALLSACYVILATAAYFYPDGQDLNPANSGPGGT